MAAVCEACRLHRAFPALLLICLSWISLSQISVAQDIGGNPRVSFDRIVYTATEVDAFSVANVVVKRETASGSGVATITVLNNTASGFFSTVYTGTFFGTDLTVTVGLSLQDDVIPEMDQTIAVKITGVSGSYDVGSPDTAYVTILANDDPFGVLAFNSPANTVVAEPSSGSSPTTFNVLRSRGTFNTVSATWTITSSSPLTSVAPTSGTVTFAPNVTMAQFQVSVLADNVPENAQVFTLTLSSLSGGATLGSPAAVTLTVPANDAPIRFTTSTATAAEGTSVVLTLMRGTTLLGQSFGDISAAATVRYRTISGNATAGQDFTDVPAGTASFGSNGATTTISIPITDDTTPELAETFQVEIYNSSSNNVVVAPSVVTVTIPASDDQNGVISFPSVGLTRQLNEDQASSRSAVFPVRRTGGTFGSVTVQWRLEDTTGAMVTSQFAATSGSITLANGATSGSISIALTDDSVPEESVGYVIRLVGVTGGARLAQGGEGALTANVRVADSDNVYGVFQFSADNLQSISSVPRQVQLSFTRTGGSAGSVSLMYTVLYIPPGGTVADGTSAVLQTAPSPIVFSASTSVASATLAITASAQLELGGSLLATITRVQLTSSIPAGAPTPMSPTIGSRGSVSLTINASLANGPVGFAPSSLNVVANESTTAQVINLQVTRDGLSGIATVSWMIQGNSTSFTSGDVGATSGSVTITDGADSVSLPITITADATPELDERFYVILTSISPAGQRLDETSRVAVVTIINNDNPGGFVSFDTSLGSSFTVSEGGSVALMLKRTGGTLERRIVDVDVSNLQATGTNDVLPTSTRALFNFGETTKQVAFAVSDDTLPELEETFTISLSTARLSSAVAANLIAPMSVTLVVPKNDDANGVISFVQTTQIILESTATTTYEANYTLTRTGGLFGSVDVYWNVTAGPTPYASDLDPVAGVVTFASGVNTGSFSIRTLQDQLPENAESFTIQLTSVSGGARLLLNPSLPTVTLLVQANDDPVFFPPPYQVDVVENITSIRIPVNRGGQENGVAVLSYSTVNGTAVAGEDFVAVSGGQVSFADGQRTAFITVNIIDDAIPERMESFSIILLSVTGDAVLMGQNTVTITIRENDDTNGIIRFQRSSLVTVAGEGSIVPLMLERLGGTFNSIVVSWVVSPPTGDVVGPATSGTVRFNDGSDATFLNMSIIADNLPELEESFTVSLVAVLSGGASLSPMDTVANITVPANDDTNGVISVAGSSMMVSIDEDIPVSMPSAGSANISLTRQRGLFGTVRVSWEVVPNGTAALRSFAGLLLAGTAGPAVTVASPRPGTAGFALTFPGGSGSLVTVPEAFQLAPQTISAGFSIVCWAKVQSSGYVLSKLNSLGVVVYGLILAPQTITFVYLPSGASGSELITATTTANLGNGSWYQIAVSVNAGEVVIYLNAALLLRRSLSSAVTDVPGPLYIGAQNTLGGGAFTGTIQDLRGYQLAFSISDLQLLSNNPASSSLQPTSGFVQFDNFSSNAALSISSVDDAIPEPVQTFTVRLLYVSGGGRFETGRTESTVSVYKSDNANGLFGLASTSRTVNEGSSTALEVVRTLGLTGMVRVSWQVSLMSSIAPASADFAPASGTIDFAAGETSKNITFSAISDNIPELPEQFIFTLTMVEVLNEAASRTPTSGASLNVARAQASVVISSNDSPYGIFQFSTSIPPSGVAFIPVSSTAPSIQLRESAGLVDIYVVRAQGTVGNATVEYTTSPGTAVGDGASPDYMPAVGTLDFAAGQLSRSFQIRINDDSTPELAKFFTLNLTNPQGAPLAPQLGVGHIMTINLLPSDDAFGVAQFDQSSVNQIIAEAPSSTVTLTVVRTGGVLGDITVSWMASSTAARDLSPLAGNVTLPVNVASQSFTVNVVNDQVPETAELFTIHLVSVSGGGRLSGNLVATITVESSDDPHGAFQFTPDSQMYSVPEVTGAVAELTVERLFGSIGTVELNYTTMMDTSVASNVRALAGVDYVLTSGMLEFAENETLKTVNVTILVDTTPEVDETFRVVLGGVRLLSAPSNPPAATSPRLASPGSSAQVTINSNDDAFGVVQFASTSLTVTEPATPPVITVLRQAGSFGDIRVTWRATGGSALENTDFFPLTGTITIRENATSGSIPLNIVDDSTPEFDETFTISIMSVAGGARIGPVSSATVTIAANDDPNGAFGFASASLSQTFSEPSSGNQPVTLTVQRTNGVVGVVTVRYTVTLADGGLASADIIPVSGQLPFTSGVTSQTIPLSILPDTVPEIDEIIQVRLISAELSTGASVRVISGFDVANITVQANDQPHGVVQFFPSTLYSTSEAALPRTLSLNIYRSEGAFGALRVTYRTRQLDLGGVAAVLGAASISYFTVTAGQGVLGSSDPVIPSTNLTHCSDRCLLSATCIVFTFSTSSDCRLYSSVGTTRSDVTLTLYTKSGTTALSRAQAQAGLDFTLLTGSSIVIPDGQRQATVTVSILSDTVPELSEYFAVDLQSVSLVSGAAALAINEPTLGRNTTSTVEITSNDAASGVFVIYATTNRQQRIRVEEQPNFALQMTIERQFGTIGTVSVSYQTRSGSATAGADFANVASVVSFGDGVSRQSFFISINDDQTPEPDEDFQVILTSVTGGAAIAASPNNSVTVVIADNDLAAGVVALAPSSMAAVVNEGDTLVLTVIRTIGNFGNVSVFWDMSSEFGNVSAQFSPTRGVVNLLPMQSSVNISVAVLVDSTPEVSAVYNVTLDAVVTSGISSVPPTGGAAVLDTTENVAIVTLFASNNPHGLVALSTDSLKRTVSEGNTNITFTIVREFGTIGDIIVYYESTEIDGSLSTVTPGQSASATAGVDFVDTNRSVVIPHGMTSATIYATIIDDSVAELTEFFLVNLTGVYLPPNDAGSTLATILPRVASPNSAEVTIPANDGTNGQLHFSAATARISVREDVGTITLTVERSQGLFGEVSVHYFDIASSAIGGGVDYVFSTNRLLVFKNNEQFKNITITIVNDMMPEQDEQFHVSLTNPTGGANISSPGTATVTILANDNANGIIDFVPDSQMATLREPVPGNSTGSSVSLVVVRSGGLFGDVVVSWQIDPDNTSDFSAASGSITFLSGDDEKTIVITAVTDALPELDEFFTVRLTAATGGAALGASTTSNITIGANSDPYGVLGIFFTNAASSRSIDVEENVGTIPLTVRRSQGAFGAISVQWQVNSGSATSVGGNTLNLQAVQMIQTGGIQRWHSFSFGNRNFMLSASRNMPSGTIAQPTGNVLPLTSTGSSESALYTWDGQWLQLQKLFTRGARAWTSWTDTIGRIFAVANYGRVSQTQINSQVFVMRTGTNYLTELQTIPTIGAVDVKYFSTGGQNYVFFVNSQDNLNNTNVDSALYRLDSGQFTLSQSIATFGGTSCQIFTTVNGQLLLVVTGSYDSIGKTASRLTRVYRWSTSLTSFQALQYLATNNAQSVKQFTVSGTDYIVVANSDRADVSRAYASTVFRWNTATSTFDTVSTIMTQDARDLNTFMLGGWHFLTISSPITGVTSYRFNAANSNFSEAQNSMLTGVVSVEPVTIVSPIFNTTLLMAAQLANGMTTVYQSSLISTQTDFIDRGGILTFAEGEREREIGVQVLNDMVPEVDETFSISIMSPSGGSLVRTDTQLSCTILTNDNAHGILGFNQASLATVVNETQMNQSVVLTVVRDGGTFGDINIDWTVTGGHNVAGNIDILPTSGTVTVRNGSASSTITLTVYADNVAELNEVSLITLNRITGRAGVAAGGDLGRGATLQAANTVSVLTVLANDEPHGVIQWSPASSTVAVDEVNNMNQTVNLQIVREFGLIGDIIIFYETASASNLPANQQAMADVDFLGINNGSVEIADGASTASVPVQILHENTPELAETFYVNITDVVLKTEASRQNSSTASPRIASSTFETSVITIRENDESRGILGIDVVLNTDAELVVSEGTNLALTVRRASGSFGTVGCSWRLTGLSASISSDVSGPVTGSLTWNEREVTKTINLVITNDDTPEIKEQFNVELYSPTGGARLGSQSSIVVAIAQNDFANGLIGFASQALLVSVPEATAPSDPAASVNLTVSRSFGRFGFVNASWAIANAAGDLTPISGSVFFLPDEMTQTIVLQTLPDIIPEGEERYSVVLTAVSGGASLRPGFTQATVVIPANDDAFGVISVAENSRNIYTQESNTVTVDIIRSKGLFRDITVRYRIRAADTNFADDTATTFSPAGDTVTLLAGVNSTRVVLQVLVDPHPEEARMYTFELVSVDNGGRLDISNAAGRITVVASNNPHGTVQLAAPLVQQVSENVGNVTFTLQRTGGSIGSVLVSYTVGSGSAVLGSDYMSPASSSVVMSTSVTSAMITVVIVNDAIPELTEDFFVTLTAIRLTSGMLNTTVLPGGFPVDIAPSLGSSTQARVDILKNDDANGVIEFSTASTSLDLHEGSGTFQLHILRTGGLFGAVTVEYTAVNATAHGNGLDFSSSTSGTSGTAVFADNQTMITISLMIIDDKVAELQEHFQVRLQNPMNGARLGTRTVSTITIRSSDDPSGVFGFDSRTLAGFMTTNPSAASGPGTITLTLIRTAGTNGNVTVLYDVFGQDQSRVHTDILPISGSVVFLQGQSMATFNLQIIADDTPELAEMFLVRLTGLAGGGRLNQSLTNTTVTIAAHNNPHGSVTFTGQSLLHRFLQEPPAGSMANLSFHLLRNDGAFGRISVSWMASGTKLSDINPTSGVVTFAENQRTAQFSIDILPDAIPELQQNFSVWLTTPSGGSVLGASLYSNFSVLANDIPHGLFQLVTGSRVVVNRSLTNAGNAAGRYITLTVSRSMGVIGNVNINIRVTFLEATSLTPVVFMQTVLAPAGQSSVSAVIPINGNYFFRPGSTFTVLVTGVMLADSVGAAGNPPLLGPSLQEVLAIPELDANSVCSFATTSLQLAVDDSVAAGSSNVWATVTRTGLLGSISVISISQITGSNASHSLMPASNTVSIADQTRTMRFGVQAIASSSLSQPAVALSLLLQSATTLTPGGVKLSNTDLVARIEPRGVVRIEPSSQRLAVLEAAGASVTVTVWRQYGAMGNITVSFATRVLASATDKALPGSDFVNASSSFVMMDDQTVASFQVDIANDDIPEDTEQFEIILVSALPLGEPATVPASPRLHSTYTSSVVTVTDDDDPSGVFSFSPSSVNLELSEGSSANIVVQRQRGQFGAANVTVRTVILTSVVQDQRANLSDFTPLDFVMQFQNGQSTANVTLSIINDNVPEINETFGLVLVNPTGGARLDQAASLISTTVVIPGNDDQYGNFGFAMNYDVAVNEDTSPTATLTIRRRAGAFGTVTIHWIAQASPDGTAGGLGEQLVAGDGDVIFQQGDVEKSFSVTLQQDTIPEPASSFYIYLQSVAPSSKSVLGGLRLAKITSSSNDAADGVYQFSVESLIVVASPGDLSVQLIVTRPSGLSSSTVQCRPQRLTSALEFYGQPATLAAPNVDYINDVNTLSFGIGVTQRVCTIVLRNTQARTEEVAPSVFNVTLQNPSGLATLGARTQAEVVITYSTIINDLSDFRDTMETNPTPDDMTNIINGLAKIPISLKPSTGVDFFIATAERAIDVSPLCTSRGHAVNMLGVFDSMLGAPVFSGRANASALVTRYAYALVSCDSCPSNKSFSGTFLNVAVTRVPTYSGLMFTGQARLDRPSDTFSFPVIPNFPARNASINQCYTVHFVEYLSQSWFTPIIDNAPVLSNKVLSVMIQGSSAVVLPFPVTYRIYTNQSRVTNRGGSCLFWNHGTNLWSNNTCNRQGQTSGTDLRYIECACNHLPDLAARADADSRVGFGIMSRISCFVCIVAMFIVYILHQLAHRANMMVATRLFLHLIFAVMALEVVFVASMYQASLTSTAGCFALGYIIHFLGLAVFLWMTIMGYNFYRTFVFDDDETERLHLRYIFIGWVLPAVVTCIYIGVTIGGLNWTTRRVYGDVHGSGDICFMADIYGALFAAVAPIVIFLGAAIYFFTLLYTNTERKEKWSKFDDFYLECDNGAEIPRLFILYVIILMTWVFASLHVAFSKDWTEIVFIIFNFAIAVYSLIMYSLIRIRALRTKGSFSPEDEVYPLGDVPTSLSTSRHSLTSLGSKKQLVLHRQVSAVSDQVVGRPTRTSINSQPGYSDGFAYNPEADFGYPPVHEAEGGMGDDDGGDFDDLMYMLKTGGSLEDDGMMPGESAADPQPAGAASAEHYQMRRISIADTHL